MELLNEVYFGRTTIEPLRKQLDIIKNKFSNKPVSATTNLDPDILKFNRLLESIFGYYTATLNINPSHQFNALAFSVDNYLSDAEKINIRKALVSSPEGFKYNKAMAKISLVAEIYVGCFESDFTTEELLAILLHEIGHSFFQVIVDRDCEYTVTRKILVMFKYINKLALDKVRSGAVVTKNIIDKELFKFSGFMNGITFKFSDFKKSLFRESMEDNMRKSRIDYTNEKFADTFVAMYGYSAELHSALIKMSFDTYKNAYGIRTYPRVIEIMKMYKIYVNDFFAYVLDIKDEHPDKLARIKTSMDYIRKELSKEGLDPKLKKELLEELNNVQKIIDDFIAFPKDQDSMRILRLYYIKLYEKFGGDRREQDTDNDALFDTIDNSYNSTRK